MEKCKEPKGEFVLVLDLNENVENREEEENQTLEEQYDFYEKQGFTKKEIIKKIAKDRNVPKNEIYQYFL